ncbi:protein-methionine-sulfoxide reductase heme-binding subunit MsrQ [Marinomonas colpomeniae]|nr:protein-methionine-sulfoxide reductase heme-binding subunit MsrQ [Marinomonas colpomeniae]
MSSSTYWDRKEKPYVMLLFMGPFLWMIASLFMGRYFPDPGKALMNISGVWASVFIIAVLSISPFVKYTSFKVLSRYRRFIGLAAFFYALFHLLVYLVLFAGLSLSWIVSDLIDKPYIYAGALAVVLLTMLAVTSTKKMMRRMGRNWKKMHKAVYIVGVCVVAHLWWQVKSDITYAAWITAFIVPLLWLRIRQNPIYQKYLNKTS